MTSSRDRDRHIKETAEGAGPDPVTADEEARRHATTIDDPGPPRSRTGTTKDDEPPTGAVGPYRVLHEIGRGGMGVVYLGMRDDDHFRRRVAIKVLKRGMDTEDVLRRFNLEQQLLATLNHPGIARWYGAGETDDGRPYFVMEHVEGLDIETYCDTHRLHVEERIELFRKVCTAVHYAHQNLVVHRDLKPSNILVVRGGEPKLLDFGIAKMLDPDMGGDVTATEFRVLTPEYASPEQVRGGPITTASDVYALGVLLYEIVSGHSPYRVEDRTPAEIQRAVCEEEPERPSNAITRVATSTAQTNGDPPTVTPQAIGRARESRPDRLRRQLSGDIDTIVLMAMRKEPERRYGSAEELAEDLDRHQRGLPVKARLDTLGYRTGKFIRRHRTGVAVTALVAFVLVAAVAGTTRAWRAAAAERNETERARQAEADLRRTAVAQRDRAERRFTQLRTLARTFMFDFHAMIAELEGSDPARVVLVTTALEYLDTLAREAGDDPELLRELADAYEQVGDIRDRGGGAGEAALGDYRAALALRQKLLAVSGDTVPDRRHLAAVQGKIGTLLRQRGDLSGALDAHRAALDLHRALGESSPGDAELRDDADHARVEVAETLHALASLMAGLGDHARATRHATEAITLLDGLDTADANARRTAIERDLPRFRGP